MIFNMNDELLAKKYEKTHDIERTKVSEKIFEVCNNFEGKFFFL